MSALEAKEFGVVDHVLSKEEIKEQTE